MQTKITELNLKNLPIIEETSLHHIVLRVRDWQEVIDKKFGRKEVNQKVINSGLETFATIDETRVDKSILKNNIFMVNLQPESVEIAKLSLWLKTAKKDEKLNNLDENIKCGNFLIDYSQIVGDAAFDWEKEFGYLKNDEQK